MQQLTIRVQVAVTREQAEWPSARGVTAAQFDAQLAKAIQACAVPVVVVQRREGVTPQAFGATLHWVELLVEEQRTRAY